MDRRHFHTHTCHHHHNQSVPPPTSQLPTFDPYGRLPRRIFPPFSGASNTSSTTSSSISQFQNRKCISIHNTRWCTCVCISIFFVVIGAAFGIYFGYHFLKLPSAADQYFRGSFRVIEGDKFDTSLRLRHSFNYRSAAAKYENAISRIFSQSVLRNAYLGSEILDFDGVDNGTLIVTFNVILDSERVRVDAGNLFITLADALRNANGVLVPINVTIDRNSVQIQDRSSIDLMYVTPSPNYTITTTTTAMTVTKPSMPSCRPTEIDFCRDLTNMTSQAYMEVVDIDASVIREMRTVVNSGCHPFASHFLCGWAVTCHGPVPCLDYCHDFLSSCTNFLPPQLKNQIKCNGPSWTGIGSCLPKPGCVELLYRQGQSQRICDGIMDCFDFSDELKCPYCHPGHFHCGSGRNCISPDKKCNGVRDCPNGSDEKSCLTVAPSSDAAGYVHQYFNEGYLFVHDEGKLGKLCVERNESMDLYWRTDRTGLLQNIGASACELLGFRKLGFVRIQTDNEDGAESYVRINDPATSSEVTFTAGPCQSQKVLYLGCNHLECGHRPVHIGRREQTVGYGDFPWHAILMKNGIHICDATLITSQWLVTALDCFEGSETKAQWTVHFGRVRKTSTSPWQQERRIIGMVKSPISDRLVLIKMATPVVFSDFARHVCLPDEPMSRQRTTWNGETTCLRLGWNKYGEVVETRMEEIGSDMCSRSRAVRNFTTLCFKNSLPGRDCWHEVKVYPGSPLLCHNSNTEEWTLTGISPMFHHPKCGVAQYEVSGIKGSTDWILKTIEVLSINDNPP